jgi:hypothetical protein
MVPVASVVLANFDAETGAQLVQLLQRNRHCATQIPATAPFNKNTIRQIPCDLIIIDLTSDDRTALTLLGEVARRRAETGPRPMVLCVASAYRGPQFELGLERKGARLAYVA